ncbi:hypothetical protein ACFSWE_09595 [Leucobacter albus]|uniref:Uncharacterized protein n=1 Tax=Leucobacter albus TaxID=272210 RepID=A0ABW3TUA4_9MICO
MTDPDVKALAREIHRLKEQVASLSRVRQLTASSIPITVDSDDGPVSIDVPLTAGVSQGVQAATDSKYAKELAEQLEAELGPLAGQVQEALAEAEAALAAAGLARSEAAQAVADAAAASAEAAQAVADALAATELAEGAAPSWAVTDPEASDAAGKPVGAIWYVRDSAGRVLRMWELTSFGWVNRPFDETAIPQVAIGSGTYGALAGDRLVAKSVTAAQIKALAITAAELAAGAVTAVKIAANAVTAEKINAGAVSTDKLSALAVTAEKIAAGAIIADKIAAGAITTAKLAATAIDGMTITGALIRTAPSGQRVQLDVLGLRTFNADGLETGVLSAGDGGFDLRGGATWRAANIDLGFARIRPPSERDGASIDLVRGAARLYLGVEDSPSLGPFSSISSPGSGIEISATRQISARTAGDLYFLSSAGKAEIASPGGIVLNGPVDMKQRPATLVGKQIAVERLHRLASTESDSLGGIVNEAMVPKMSVQFALPEPAQVRVTAMVRAYSNNMADVLAIRLRNNGAVIAEWTKQANSAGTGTTQTHNIGVTKDLSAGSHSLVLYVLRAAGSGSITVAPNATGPNQLTVEEIVLTS